MKFFSNIITFTLLSLFAFTANAEEAAFIRKNLTKNFAGQIIQPGVNGDSQDVLITLLSVTTDKSGMVTAVGRGEFYHDDHRSRSFEFSWKINADTLRFEMVSKTISGPYIGNISKGLDSIEAIHEPDNGKSKGRLVLYAVVKLDP